MTTKGVNHKYKQSTYGSPEHSQHPYTLTPDYNTPEANAPDPNASSTTFGNLPAGEAKAPVQDTFAQDKLTQMAGVAVGDKFTQAPMNERATYGMPIPSSSQAAAGTSTNPEAGTYPTNPTPMQGPGDEQATGAVMPKLQVQGDPKEVYGIRQAAKMFKGWATIRGHRVFIPDSPTMARAHQDMLDRGYRHDKSEPSETGVGQVHHYVGPDGKHRVKFYANEDGLIGDTSVADEETQKAGWKEAYDWPHNIVFDWNGTIDARKTGQGLPWSEVQKLIDAGKNVVIFTSSVNASDKEFMRRFLFNRGVKYTDDKFVLDKADLFVGDKNSDRRRAGFHGIKYVDVREFDADKLLAKSLDVPPGMGAKPTVLPDGRTVTLSPQHDDTGKYQYHISDPVMTPMNELQVDNPNQPLQPNKVQERQQRIESQGIQNLKPLAAWENGPGQPLTVVDGHHRIEAAEREGKQQVPVVVLSRSVIVRFGKSVSKPGYSHTVIDSKQENQNEIGLGNVTRPQVEGVDKVTPGQKAKGGKCPKCSAINGGHFAGCSELR